MTDIAKAAHIASKLTECRSGARLVLGEKYCSKISEWVDAIKKLAGRVGITETQAAIEMAKEDQDGGMTTILIMAALAEILEPSPECIAPQK